MTVPTPESAPTQRRTRLIVGTSAAVAAVAITAIVLATLVFGNDTTASPAASPTGASTTPTPSASPVGATIPDGWATRTSASGAYSYAYDPAWDARDPATVPELLGPLVGPSPAYVPDFEAAWRIPGSDGDFTLIGIIGATFTESPPSAKSAVNVFASTAAVAQGSQYPITDPERSVLRSSPDGSESWYVARYASTDAFEVVGVTRGNTTVFVFLGSVNVPGAGEELLSDLASSVTILPSGASSAAATAEPDYTGAPIQSSDVVRSGVSLRTDRQLYVAFEYSWDWVSAGPPADPSGYPLANPFDSSLTDYMGSWTVTDPEASEVVPEFVVALVLHPNNNPYSTLDDAHAAAVTGSLANTAGATAGETRAFSTALGLEGRMTSLHWVSDSSAQAETLMVTVGRGHRFVVILWVGRSGPVDRAAVTELLDTLRIDI